MVGLQSGFGFKAVFVPHFGFALNLIWALKLKPNTSLST
jgi:hypothetical protein